MERYEPWDPLIVALRLFMMLQTTLSFLRWIPVLKLMLVFVLITIFNDTKTEILCLIEDAYYA
jgi:hypothetical protein